MEAGIDVVDLLEPWRRRFVVAVSPHEEGGVRTGVVGQGGRRRKEDGGGRRKREDFGRE